MRLVCPLRANFSLSVATSQSFTVGFHSSSPVANVLPSGENATLPPPVPRRVARTLPVVISHNFTVSSAQPLARSLPSGENARQRTVLPCWPRLARSLPV